jgi:hypothetical protein
MKGLQFSPDMAEAVVRGDKWQTRRLVRLKGLPRFDLCKVQLTTDWSAELHEAGYWPRLLPHRKPVPGESVFMQEKWRVHKRHNHLKPSEIDFSRATVFYAASGAWPEEAGRPRAAMHMPLQASRRVLEITGLRVERLHDISPQDAEAEGVHYDDLRGLYYGCVHPKKGTRKVFANPIEAYKSIFESIYGAGSWSLNPWVWVIDFKATPNPYAPEPARHARMAGVFNH